ncbi:MAG: MgtC/SapB family protein, partial [Patescibacteria group bacterium]
MDFINNLAIQINPGEMKMVFQVVLAALLGAFVGFEREYTGKAAGLRTYALVCLGAALFTILSKA